MPDPGKTLDEVMARLKTLRDELSVKVHLGKADAKDEWEKLEKKWSELSAKAQPVKEVAGETAKNVGAALEMALDEIKAGYDSLKKKL